ncbi:hypothetical protein SAY87_015295 [Trapa incisa]|uniref:Growth-regulating factor n=1 Tax=Trapa incisa TaxID=236973 RepID=A0AAN7H0X3_9MYRT|nr:hypothetical protein SAY87_015295 [Trapa incisa]
METGGGFRFGDFGGASGGSASSSGEEAAAASTRSFLPFNSAATATAAHADTLYPGPSSPFPGGMMGSSRGTAFTLAQMEELERQKLIFKYMVVSIPVPPQLLLPLKSSTGVSSARISGSSSSSDPEPWRCKRTDGKKWRCSRDVVPHQKYCERHSHKNRPRSRKPVEFLSNNTTTANNKPIMQSRDPNLVSSSVTSQESLTHLLPYQASRDFSHAAGSGIPRSLEWFMKGEVIALPNTGQVEWQQHPHEQHQQYAPLSPYEPDHELQARGGGRGRHIVNDQCSLLLGMSSSECHNWPEDSTSLSKKVPTSSLSLEIFGRVGEEGEDEERTSIGQIMGLSVGPGTVHSAQECDRRAESRPHWMNPGGPLAEALCLGSTSTQESPPSDQT